MAADKRYLVFGYCNHDAGGGFNDIIDSFDSFKEADEYKISYEYKQIYDRMEGVLLYDDYQKR